MLDTLYNGFAGLVGTLNDLMYSYVLIILLLAAGLYFTIRSKGVQLRLLGESVRVVSEKSGDTKAVSAFEDGEPRRHGKYRRRRERDCHRRLRLGVLDVADRARRRRYSFRREHARADL